MDRNDADSSPAHRDPGVPTAVGAVGRFAPPQVRGARLLVAVLLLLLGTLGTLKLIAEFDHSVRVLATKRTLMPGERVSAADLVTRDLHLSGGTDRYFRSDAEGSSSPHGHLVQHVVGAGELLPRSALGPGHSAGAVPVSIVLDGAHSDLLRPGTYAQLWVAQKAAEPGPERFDKAAMCIERVLVRKIDNVEKGTSPRASETPAEIYVPKTKVGEVIDHLNGHARLTLVPTNG